MLKIRLSRTGKKSQPSFKVVVQEHTAPIKGKFVEELGFYRPAEDPKIFKVNTDRVKYWISVGATPSDTMAVLLKKEGLEGMEKYIAPRDKQRKKKKQSAESKASGAPKTEKPETAEEGKGETVIKEEEPKAEEPPKEEEKPAETPKEEPPAEKPTEESPKEEQKPE